MDVPASGRLPDDAMHWRMTLIIAQGLTKRYGDMLAVDNVDLR